MNGAATSTAEQALRKPELQKTPELAPDSQLESVFDAQGPSGLIEMGSQEIQALHSEIEMMAQPDPEAASDAPAEASELSTARDQARAEIDQAFEEMKHVFETAEVPAPDVKIEAGAPEVPPTEPSAAEQAVPEAEAVTAEEAEPVEEAAPTTVEAVPATSEMTEGHDWEAMIGEEKTKLEAAKADYEEANRAYQDYVAKNPKPWTPIQQKYAKAMETQIAMDEGAWKHADNQIALYGANRDIEVLAKAPVEGSNTGAKLDALIADRNAKDAMSNSLAAEYEKMKADHDAALADYMHALELIQGGEEEELPALSTSPGEVVSSPEAPSGSQIMGGGVPVSGGGSAEKPKAEKKPGIFGRITGAIDKQVKRDLATIAKPVSGLGPTEKHQP